MAVVIDAVREVRFFFWHWRGEFFKLNHLFVRTPSHLQDTLAETDEETKLLQVGTS
jgi:hypothetical protein